ncbi:MAG: pseudouridine synthase [Proteobacteria bacterium]|nr:pseudouridine synthase [Pseudomonadota bacterium]
MNKKNSPQHIRVQKWLANKGVASRREIDGWIKESRLKINGVMVTPGDRLHEAATVHSVDLDGAPLHLTTNTRELIDYSKKTTELYGICYKPSRVLVSRRCQGGKTTIYDLPHVKKFCQQVPSGFIPYVGRLDYLSEGLILLTTDGKIAEYLTHPKYRVPKIYIIALPQELTYAQIKTIRNGMVLDDGPVDGVSFQATECPSYLQGVTDDPSHQDSLNKKLYWYKIVLYQGRKRLIRRMLKNVKVSSVVRLIRIQKAGLKLPKDLSSGALLEITREHIKLK